MQKFAILILCAVIPAPAAAQLAAAGAGLGAALRACMPGLRPGAEIRASGWQAIDTANAPALWMTGDTVSLPAGRASVLDVYRLALEFHESPLRALTRDQETRLRDAQSVLMYRRTLWDWLLRKNTATWQSAAYMEYRRAARAYAEAVDRFDRGPAAGTQAARDAVAAAANEWTLRGHRVAVDSALATTASLAAADPGARWAERAQHLQHATAQGAGRPAIVFSPGPSEWRDENGWTQCRPAAEGAGAITFDVKLVSVARDWLDSTMFVDRQWRWLDSVPGGATTAIADGSGGGRLPFYPESLILVRDLRMPLGEGATSQTPGVIAVGWTGTRLPASPDPSPDLQWGVPAPPSAPAIRAVGLTSAITLDGSTATSLRGAGRHVTAPGVYIQFRFAPWLLIGNAAGPHLGSPGLAVAVTHRLRVRRDIAFFGGLRFGRGVDGSKVQGLAGVAMPVWTTGR